MKAGREMDRLVAMWFFSHKVVEHKEFGRMDYYIDMGSGISPVPRYSDHIACAWEIVKWLEAREFNCSLSYSQKHKLWKFSWGMNNDFDTFPAAAETAPHAICLSVLKSKERNGRYKLPKD